ncbi:MAG: NrdH-redoxin [Dehalococcoidia bacterium]|nr:NrdH-redoxin [Dehalococcoidia bacterium]
MANVTVYGKTTCEDTIRSRAFLDTHKIQYTWVDVEKSEEGRRTAIAKNPKNRLNTPTIVFQDGTALVEPSDEELGKKLRIR